MDISSKEFIEKIFDYENEKEWSFKGSKPAVVDFYADWCGPCQAMAPMFEALASEYGEKVDFFKINVDNEQELSGAFGIRSIPTILFIPAEGEPMMQPGALPANVMRDVIEKRLLI